MSIGVAPVVRHASVLPAEGWQDRDESGLVWWTLISADRTTSRGITAGVAELEVGGELEPHWHATDEVYHVVGGIGEVLLDDTWHSVEPGSTLFIPGNIRHAIRNVGDEVMRLFYCFPTDSFGDVVYYFPSLPEGPDDPNDADTGRSRAHEVTSRAGGTSFNA